MKLYKHECTAFLVETISRGSNLGVMCVLGVSLQFDGIGPRDCTTNRGLESR